MRGVKWCLWTSRNRHHFCILSSRPELITRPQPAAKVWKNHLPEYPKRKKKIIWWAHGHRRYSHCLIYNIEEAGDIAPICFLGRDLEKVTDLAGVTKRFHLRSAWRANGFMTTLQCLLNNKQEMVSERGWTEWSWVSWGTLLLCR